ncbi:uncharacterized protein (DUF1800 family) [Roseinatronobacter thiooxidans]|uniref:Uncharacterized protein (DUF1800 family) n=1 Tax=Roseinatronobacter thiooxidans TaxID=121821 RepID=A0A2W7Q1F3_9RHOB|nr:DUF1800 domain-containing protein [Roseinatronobacter thiooxidans]PZX42358.1 uncharacterized protein (DUF1800 family) [Roseinatronobacter thiooxidans]
MISTHTLASIRFGAGLGPNTPAGLDAAALWDSVPREAVLQDAAITPWDTRRARALERRDAQRALRDGEDPALRARLQEINRADRDDSFAELRAMMARLAYAPAGFAERLVRFWSNHFAAQTRGGVLRAGRAAMIEDAIRPNMTGTFQALLRAAILHPVMLVYLDQTVSVGPFSRVGRRRGRGLNENMAREVLELHTLGRAGSYTQADVTQFARLLTGLAVSLEEGFHFEPRIAEPGILEIFGKRYGGRPMTLGHIHDVLDDLALRPETADHLALKLARHFVADTPDPQLVAHMAASYLHSGGALMALYRAMLEHPAAWGAPLSKTRAPFEVMAAALRALDLPRAMVTDLTSRQTRFFLAHPLEAMGEPFEQVPSPAGYGEDAAYWVTPQGLAARIDWAMELAQRLPQAPDPRDFVEIAMADAASDTLRRAASGAETRAQGIGLILSAPEFNRR